MNNIAITISAAILLAWIILAAIWCAIDSFGEKNTSNILTQLKLAINL